MVLITVCRHLLASMLAPHQDPSFLADNCHPTVQQMLLNNGRLDLVDGMPTLQSLGPAFGNFEGCRCPIPASITAVLRRLFLKLIHSSEFYIA